MTDLYRRVPTVDMIGRSVKLLRRMKTQAGQEYPVGKVMVVRDIESRVGLVMIHLVPIEGPSEGLSGLTLLDTKDFEFID